MTKPCASPQETQHYIDELLDILKKLETSSSSVLSYDSPRGCEYCKPNKNNQYKQWVHNKTKDSSRLCPPNLRFPSWAIIVWNKTKAQWEDFLCDIEFCPKCERSLSVN